MNAVALELELHLVPAIRPPVEIDADLIEERLV